MKGVMNDVLQRGNIVYFNNRDQWARKTIFLLFPPIFDKLFFKKEGKNNEFKKRA